MSQLWSHIKARALASLGEVVPHSEAIRSFFRLPEHELLCAESSIEFLMEGSEIDDRAISGTIYLTTSFLCFCATDKVSAAFTIPLFAIKRVERLHNRHARYCISILTWHRDKICLTFSGLRNHTERFLDLFKANLNNHVSNMKVLQPFLHTCYSEFLLAKLEDGKIGTEPPSTGMGVDFSFPGDPRKLKDRSKMRLWVEYFQRNGRNLTLVRFPLFYKLVRVGLPNQLRGEVWELTSGAMLARWAAPGEYSRLLQVNSGKNTLSMEEIEKDLNRSLPEYPAYQENNSGIDSLRRVLTAYSWRNPEVGYCQAMNIIVAAILIFAAEEQAFWLLDTICNDFLPGYYSTTMYGTLLDQKVFEALVESTMPLLWNHLHKSDLQLSLVSLPWFLSLYVNSMPLLFACRVLDCFFLEGPRVLFQVGLAILKLNGDALLNINDDGAFIELLKSYFMKLDDSAYPLAENKRQRAISKFQELMVTAFKEFEQITHETILAERRKYKEQTLESIESFAKRTQIRALASTGRLNKHEISFLYDRYHHSHDAKRLGIGGTTDVRMDLDTFVIFMSGIVNWVKLDEPAHPFLKLLFDRWDTSVRGSLSFQNIITGVSELRMDETTPMESLTWFFDIFDRGDGKLTYDDLLSMTEALLWLTRLQNDDDILRSISSFMHRCYDYAEQNNSNNSSALVEGFPDAIADKKLFVSLPTFRMVVLADPALEDFFTNVFPRSLQISELKDMSKSARGLRGLLDAVIQDGNKVAGELRRISNPEITVLDADAGLQEQITAPSAADRALLTNDLL